MQDSLGASFIYWSRLPCLGMQDYAVMLPVIFHVPWCFCGPLIYIAVSTVQLTDSETLSSLL